MDKIIQQLLEYTIIIAASLIGLYLKLTDIDHFMTNFAVIVVILSSSLLLFFIIWFAQYQLQKIKKKRKRWTSPVYSARGFSLVEKRLRLCIFYHTFLSRFKRW